MSFGEYEWLFAEDVEKDSEDDFTEDDIMEASTDKKLFPIFLDNPVLALAVARKLRKTEEKARKKKEEYVEMLRDILEED